MLQNLLLTDHMTTPGIKEIYKVNGGGGGREFSQESKTYRRNKTRAKKINPRHNLHTLTFAA